MSNEDFKYQQKNTFLVRMYFTLKVKAGKKDFFETGPGPFDPLANSHS